MTMLSRNDARPDGVSSTPPKAVPEIKYRMEAASYVAAMIAELRQISGKAGFAKLVGVLDAAYYEAYTLTDAKAEPQTASAEKTSPRAEPPPP